MSTHAVVADIAGDGWRGRYVHADGYPTSMVSTLRDLVARDGLDTVLQTVVHGEAYGWS